MAQELKNLAWIEELLPPETVQKRMFGGVAFYLDEKLILILMESGGGHTHKGFKYPFEIWNGCLFPVEKIKQSAVFLKYPALTSHPVTEKWLYLPYDTEDFEEIATAIVREIKKRNPLFGTVVKVKDGAGKKKVDVVDTKKPRMFVEEPKPKKEKKPKAEMPKEKKKTKADKKPENAMILNVLKKKRPV